MKKASKYLTLIGNSLEIVFTLACIFLVVVSFIITSPSSVKMIEEGITSGRITPMGGSTLAEQVQIIQRAFTVFGIVLIVIVLIAIACILITFLSIREEDTRHFTITALVLSIFSANILLIIGLIFKIIDKEEE